MGKFYIAALYRVFIKVGSVFCIFALLVIVEGVGTLAMSYCAMEEDY